MTPAQLEAFEGANRGAAAFTADAAGQVWAGVLMLVVLLWAAWVLVQVYKAWSQRRAVWGDAGGQVLRAVFVLLVVWGLASAW